MCKTHNGYYHAYLGMVYAVICLLGSSNGNRIFNVLDYGAIGDGKHDDTHAFSKAWGDVCGYRGNVAALVVPKQKTFLLTSIVFLGGGCNSRSIHFQIEGKIVAPDSMKGWENSCVGNTWISFEYVDNLIIYGHGEIDGKGSLWWKKLSSFSKLNKRPCRSPQMLFFHECNGLQLRGLKLKDSPSSHVKLLGCDNSIISNIHITAPTNSPNTDGIDVSWTSQLHILDSIIQTGDDCIAILSQTSWINIKGVTCGPGHGISVGSLGMDGSEAMVEEIHVENCTLHGTQNGARIKTCQGGKGYVRKITFHHINLIDVQYPIVIDQFYCVGRHCKPEARAVEVKQVTYSKFRGTSATEAAITLNCSKAIPCTNIIMQNINITSGNGTEKVYSSCQNVHGRQSSVSPRVPCI